MSSFIDPLGIGPRYLVNSAPQDGLRRYHLSNSKDKQGGLRVVFQRIYGRAKSEHYGVPMGDACQHLAGA